MKKYIFKTIAISVIIIIAAMALEVAILANVNRSNAYRLTNMLLNQVVDIVNTSNHSASELLESVKDDYKVRAQSVSYILDLNPAAENNIDELKKIAGLLSIDEIHLFDETGKIYYGTVPKYYGYSMDSGEQMGFFKPMLTDKSLILCQDVTPNTAEAKSMMYAMTWDNAGKKLVQIGIEPARLLEFMRSTQISERMKNIPVYEGMKVFIADAGTGKIIGCSSGDDTFGNISDFNLSENFNRISGTKKKIISIGGKKYFSSFCNSNGYVYCVAYNMYSNLKKIGFTIWIILIYLFIAAGCISFTILDKARSTEEKLVQYRVLLSMSKIYYSMHLINLKSNSVTEYEADEIIRRICKGLTKADEMMTAVITHMVSNNYKERMLEFTDINTVAERLKGKKIITEDFIGISGFWFRASFITINRKKSLIPAQVIFTVQNVEEEKNREAVLVHKSTTDELTGCYNRRAYQEDLKNLKLEEEFIYAAFDLNELKNTNDTIGHEAGDELIQAAAEFMKQSFSAAGKVYRTGGDEFAAIVFTNLEKFEKNRKDFDSYLNSWSGNLVKSISVSYGFVSSQEAEWNSIHEIAKEADRRMYRSKSAYYQKSGVDRRANQRAYFAASALYTKILKINLTNDSYKVINMNKDEQNESKGYSNILSAWFRDFALTGQIYEEDREEYLKKTDLSYMKDYFGSGRKMLSLYYRRKINEEYKQVIMEIIPSDDYQKDNQDCYLYVKKIEKE